MPISPGYEALVHGRALVRRSDRAVVRVHGADRVAWLQGLVTNDVSKLAEGQRVYAAYLTPQGRMITDLWIVATADALLLDVPAVLSSDLASKLDGLVFAEDIQIEEGSRELAVLQLFGVVEATDAADEPTGGANGSSVLAIPDRTYGVPSRAVYLPVSRVTAFLAALPPDCVEAGLDDLDVVRVEAGVPRFLVDMTDDTIPLEAGLEDRAISFTKGCYVGQEVIVRVTTRGGGRVARRLVGLRLEAAEEPPPAGAPIHAGERAVGRVTSAVFSPRCETVIALGYVHRDFAGPGTGLEIHHDADRLAAVVHALPFIPPLA